MVQNKLYKIDINSYRIAIAIITVIAVSVTKAIHNSILQPESNESFIIAFTIIYAVIIWSFNLGYYSFAGRYLNKLTYGKSFFVRIIGTFILGFAIVFAFMQYGPIIRSVYHISANKSPIIVRGIFFNILVLVTIYATDLLEKTQKIEIENQKLINQNLSTQLQLLKQQIKPHFLFNSLNNLKSLIKEKDGKAEDFIIHLAELYRYLLQTNTEDKITIEEDIKILESYIFMLRSRFTDCLEFFIEMDRKLYRSFVPPLTFQILIENCVKHNIISKTKPLKIDIISFTNRIMVRNNLQEKKLLADSNCFGLSNLQQRYLLICNRPIEVIKDDKEFTVSLPIIY
jgi:two-component system, LytTR family, sensor kinase